MFQKNLLARNWWKSALQKITWFIILFLGGLSNISISNFKTNLQNAVKEAYPNPNNSICLSNDWSKTLMDVILQSPETNLKKYENALAQIVRFSVGKIFRYRMNWKTKKCKHDRKDVWAIWTCALKVISGTYLRSSYNLLLAFALLSFQPNFGNTYIVKSTEMNRSAFLFWHI